LKNSDASEEELNRDFDIPQNKTKLALSSSSEEISEAEEAIVPIKRDLKIISDANLTEDDYFVKPEEGQEEKKEEMKEERERKKSAGAKKGEKKRDTKSPKSKKKEVQEKEEDKQPEEEKDRKSKERQASANPFRK